MGTTSLLMLGGESQMQKTFYKLIVAASERHASDIYIWPDSDGFQVIYYSATGIEKVHHFNMKIGEALIRHIKFSAHMDISEVRRPQLGRWHYLIGQQSLHLRVSSVADFLNRESIVIRLIYDMQDNILDWQPKHQLNELADLLKLKQGLILLAGKMGSGKTTTLYHVATNHLDNQMVLTIEDPVELVAPEFLQLQVNNAAHMGYEQLLKLALRHHPDIMIIGEIRDAETAHIVVQAALSGHLILSTVHAMSIKGIWYRLRAFGVPIDLLNQVVVGLGYQEMMTRDNQSYVNLKMASGKQLNELLVDLKNAETHAMASQASS